MVKDIAALIASSPVSFWVLLIEKFICSSVFKTQIHPKYSLTLNTQLDPIDFELNTLEVTIPGIEGRKVTAPSNTLLERQEFWTCSRLH